MPDIKEEYNILKKKHSLPDFEVIDKAFEISVIEDTKLLMPCIRKRINEKINYFCEILEDLLHPNTDLRSLNECRFFDDSEKLKMFKIYKELMVLNRTGTSLHIENNEKEDAEFIKEIARKWKDIKKDMSNITNKLKNSWKKEIEGSSKLEYLG